MMWTGCAPGAAGWPVPSKCVETAANEADWFGSMSTRIVAARSWLGTTQVRSGATLPRARTWRVGPTLGFASAVNVPARTGGLPPRPLPGIAETLVYEAAVQPVGFSTP